MVEKAWLQENEAAMSTASPYQETGRGIGTDFQPVYSEAPFD